MKTETETQTDAEGARKGQEKKSRCWEQSKIESLPVSTRGSSPCTTVGFPQNGNPDSHLCALWPCPKASCSSALLPGIPLVTLRGRGLWLEGHLATYRHTRASPSSPHSMLCLDTRAPGLHPSFPPVCFMTLETEFGFGVGVHSRPSLSQPTPHVQWG